MPIVESKDAANYTRDGSPAEHCGNCAHYQGQATNATGPCQIVAGRVDFGGWCRHWRYYQQAA